MRSPRNPAGDGRVSVAAVRPLLDGLGSADSELTGLAVGFETN